MDAMRNAAGLKRQWAKFAAITTIAMLIITGLSFTLSYAQQTFVNLSAGPGAPGASGEATISLLSGGVAVGEIEVNNLPPQAYPRPFYGVWFVRTDTGDKAFLGALISNESIIFSAGGNGEMRFSATFFTDGPHKGAPISFGTPGNNFIVVIIESAINGFMPFPISTPPSSFAVSGTF